VKTLHSPKALFIQLELYLSSFVLIFWALLSQNLETQFPFSQMFPKKGLEGFNKLVELISAFKMLPCPGSTLVASGLDTVTQIHLTPQRQYCNIQQASPGMCAVIQSLWLLQ